jgi:hypothetical protein
VAYIIIFFGGGCLFVCFLRQVLAIFQDGLTDYVAQVGLELMILLTWPAVLRMKSGLVHAR